MHKIFIVDFDNQKDFNILLHRTDNNLEELKSFYMSIRNSKRKKVFCGPKRLEAVKDFLKTEFVEVLLVDAFDKYQEILDELKLYIEDKCIYLFSAGFSSKCWIADLLKINKNITCLDIGSSFDALFIGQTRTFQVDKTILEKLYKNVGKKYPKVSIIVPTLGRPDKLQRLLKSIEENANYPNYEVIVEKDCFGSERQGVPKTLKKGVEKSSGELVMYLGNDCICEKNFLKIAVEEMIKSFPDMDGLVGLNDCYWNGEFFTHWLASKKLLPYLEGEFFHRGYHHTGCDNELTERCRLIGKCVWCEESKVYHDHPVQTGFKIKDMDEVYKLAYDQKNVKEDSDLLYQRAEKYGFPVRGPFGAPRKYPQVHPSYDLRIRLKDYNLKVLNVGVGPGNSGIASQLPFFRFKQLTHLDVHLPYLEEAKKVIWDSEQVEFINQDVRKFDFSDFDLVLFFDILEHLPKEDSLEILKKSKKSLVFMPLEKEFRKNIFGVDSQDHLSFWIEKDFLDLDFKTEVIKDFNHGDFVSDVIWAWKGISI